MDRDEVWDVINAHRERVVSLLEDLSDDEWTRQSLCAGWTVRDVAGHLAWQANASVVSGLVDMVKARGNIDRLIDTASRRHALRPIPELVEEVRATIGTRKKPFAVTHLEQLIDILVHSQDIVLPLGRSLPLPPDAAGVAASRSLAIKLPWHAAKRFSGLRLVATDTDWTWGEGAQVEGPMEALLLVVTGRPVAMPRLTGPGLDRLA